MKLIKPSFEIIKLDDGETILKDIERVARDCYQSEDKIEYEHYINHEGEAQEWMGDDYVAKLARVLIPKLIARKHFADMTVRFITDRCVSHELVRHRLCSFAQESTRYCNYGKDEHISFIIPSDNITLVEGLYGNTNNLLTKEDRQWIHALANCEISYNRLIKLGWSPQQARSVLPNSLKTTINVKANLREWRTIFEQRTSKAAHPDMRAIMCPLLDEVKTRIPIIFDDINY